MANKISTVRTYPLNGAVNFTITFEYLARKFVKVTLIGKDRKELVLNQDYRFTTKTQITTSRTWTAADGYQMIEIRRFTSATDRLVDFADGSILRAYDLNISQVQTLHVAEEARDLTADTIGVNNDGHLDARGRRIVNLANAVDDRDAIPLGQLKTMNQNSWQARNEALQFRNEAETFRNQADGFKNESSTHATNAKQWRDEANEFRNEAEQFKNTSGQYAASAGSYAGNAKDSEDEARRIAENIKASGRISYITRRSFEKGFNVTTWNEALLWEEDGEYYRWDGTLPKIVPAGSTPDGTGEVKKGAWVSVGDAVLRGNLRSDVDGMGDALIAVKQPVSGAIARTQHDKNAELVTGGDLGETPTRNLFSTENNTALGAYSFKSFSFNAIYNCFVGAHAGESIVGSESDIAIGSENTGVGHGAGRRITTGKRNITVGAEAGSLITTGSFNIVIGAQSSSASGEKTGDLNTICGYNAGKNWTTAIRNSFYGSDAGSATTTGNDNAAFGQAAMQNNTTGGGNTYLGAFAGAETGTGGNNLAAGRSALFRNIDGSGNVALGREAAMGVSGSGASPNNITVMGFQAGWSQNGLTGVVFCGMRAGYRATTMADTVLLGRAAGFNLTTGSNNVMVGAATGDSETTGTQLVYLGHGAGRFLIDGSAATGKLNCVAIGYQARVGGNHEIQMGNSSQTVYVYGTVQTRSDERDKADVRDIPADVAVAFVRGLRSCMYKFDYRDDYIEEYIEEVGTDAEGKPVYETKIRHLDKDGSKKRTREHAGYLAQQVKELMDKLGFDCGIYQDHLVNEGGCDVKTLAYEQTIPFITKALDVAFTKLDDIENRLSAIEKSKEN